MNDSVLSLVVGVGLIACCYGIGVMTWGCLKMYTAIAKYETALKKIANIPAITKKSYDRYAMLTTRQNINDLITKVNTAGNTARRVLNEYRRIYETRGNVSHRWPRLGGTS